MKNLDPRPVTVQEASVISAALERAPFGERCDASRSAVATLRVVGKCQCGCGSLFFDGIQEEGKHCRVADGIGYTPDGEETGVIVWALGSRLVHLELYNYSEQPARLPAAESICSFERTKGVSFALFSETSLTLLERGAEI